MAPKSDCLHCVLGQALIQFSQNHEITYGETVQRVTELLVALLNKAPDLDTQFDQLILIFNFLHTEFLQEEGELSMRKLGPPAAPKRKLNS